MKKKVFISMYALHIGGAERSLIGLLESFDFDKYEVDLFLYSHKGEFMQYIPREVNLLPEIKEYITFEKSIKDVIKEGHYYLGAARLLARFKANMKNKGMVKEQRTYKQMQYMWHYSLPKLPRIKKKYDIALSFLGPHYFVLEKVDADVKLGWNHTDYFTIVNPDKKLDEAMWSRLNYIVHVSESCEQSFHKVFPGLKSRSIVLENILSPAFIQSQSDEPIHEKSIEVSSVKICSVGRYSNQKGFDMAVLACKKLVDQGYDVVWYLVGYGSEEELIKRLIKENQLEHRFILLGKQINPYPYVKKCDIYCQPSRYEGKAVTVREAQMLAKPVVITNFLTANSQLENEVDGYICELSVDGIADGIAKLIKSREFREHIAENCKNRDYSNRSEVEKIYSLMSPRVS